MTKQKIVETVAYTEAELAEFNHLTLLAGSRDQVRRIDGRMGLTRFVAAHGQVKCDEMFAEIKRREAAAKKRRRR